MKGLQSENFYIALRSIRGQMLRTTLTALIIAVGITALVGILTAIDALQFKIENDFSRMGANTFNLVSNAGSLRGKSDGERQMLNPQIRYEEAQEFLARFDYPAAVAISAMVSFAATASYQSKSTNPNVKVIGISSEYLTTAGYKLAQGRGFSNDETDKGIGVAIIGSDIVDKLFDNVSERAIGESVFVGAKRFTVVGILESKGNSIGFSGDNQILIPLTNAKLNFLNVTSDYSVNIQTTQAVNMEAARIAATGLFRSIRGDRPGQNDSFGITQSDSLANMLLGQISIIAIIATIIGAITLIGAAIGLMNIMLVSVTERTREIGIRKSIGASSAKIRRQFLMEAVVIGQIGGILGILFGLAIGNVIAVLIESSFIIPWRWIIGGIILCFFVGIGSGYYPAKKAADLDPIDALRYE